MNTFERSKIPYLQGDAIPRTNLSKADIEKYVCDVAEAFEFKVGDDLQEFVQRLGGRIHYQSLDEMMAESGSIYVHDKADFDILLPHYTSPTRDRFTTAHEIGHYFLHSNQGEQPIIAMRQGSTRIEWEANWFAAQLLMPRDAFREIVLSATNDAEIAWHFGVSLEAVAVRRKSLGICPLALETPALCERRPCRLDRL